MGSITKSNCKNVDDLILAVEKEHKPVDREYANDAKFIQHLENDTILLRRSWQYTDNNQFCNGYSSAKISAEDFIKLISGAYDASNAFSFRRELKSAVVPSTNYFSYNMNDSEGCCKRQEYKQYKGKTLLSFELKGGFSEVEDEYRYKFNFGFLPSLTKEHSISGINLKPGIDYFQRRVGIWGLLM